jgi:hypothetical protein
VLIAYEPDLAGIEDNLAGLKVARGKHAQAIYS